MTVERSRASKSVAESLDRVLDGGIIILDRDTLLSVLGLRLLVLEDIPPAPRGIPQVEVTFSIDADGIVKARARDMATGKERGMKMAADGGLPKEEFEPLKAEGEEFSRVDTQRRREIRARNEADTAIHLAERTLVLRGAESAPDAPAAVHTGIARLRAALRGQSVSRIEVATRELRAALFSLV